MITLAQRISCIDISFTLDTCGIVVNEIGIVTFTHFISNSFLHFVPISFASQPRNLRHNREICVTTERFASQTRDLRHKREKTFLCFSFLFETYFRQKIRLKGKPKVKVKYNLMVDEDVCINNIRFIHFKSGNKKNTYQNHTSSFSLTFKSRF